MRNKPRTKTIKTDDQRYTLKEVETYNALPEHYFGFPDDIPLVIRRADELEDKLSKRGYSIPRPLRMTRLVIKQRQVPVGKKTKTVMNEKPITFLALEVEYAGQGR